MLRRLRKVANLPWVHDRLGDPRDGQLRGDERLVATAGFEHDERRLERLELSDQLRQPRALVRDHEGLSGRPHAHVESRLRDVDSYEHSDLLATTEKSA